MLTNENVLNQQVTSATSEQKQRVVAANSTILFMLAYLLCYLVSQLGTVAAAFSARIPTVLHPGHLEFKIADAAWRKSDIISVYGTGPLAALVLAFAAALLFLLVRKKRGLQKTFFLWTFLHGCNLFFGALIAGTITQSGFWYAFRWSGFSDTGVWFTAFLFLIILLATGVLAAPAFLISCDSISLMEYTKRRQMLTATIVWPWICGTLLLLLLKFPDLQYYDTLPFFTLLFLLLPAYFLNQQNLFSETVEMPKRTRLAQSALFLLIAAALIVRFFILNGRFVG